MLNVGLDVSSLQKLEKNVLKCNEETEKLKKKEILKNKDRLLTTTYSQSVEVSGEPSENPSQYQNSCAPKKDKKQRSFSDDEDH